MEKYENLTRSGRLHRLRKLAENALSQYPLNQPCLRFYLSAGNTLYTVFDSQPHSVRINTDLFVPGKYLLRIYQPDWQSEEAISLELAWLSAMRREADLPVPEPIATHDGRLLTTLNLPGSSETRTCSLLRWVKGRLLPEFGHPKHYRAQGRLMAEIHNLTQGWTLPVSHEKRHYDWNGLFMNDAEIGLPPGKSWEYLPPAWIKPFENVTQHFRQLIDRWGISPKVYGLIHADMGLDANLLFWHGQPRLIDFDGSGFGYWMYDLAVALAHLVGRPNYDRMRDALFEGYTSRRSLPAAQLAQLDLFTAGFYVYYILWIVGGTHQHPEYLTDNLEESMDRGAAFILNFVEKHC